jgi:hypothetical protein
MKATAWAPAVAGLAGGWLALASPAAAQDQVQQWRRWERKISSSVDFWNNGAGNPYSDLVLRVRFTKRGTTKTFTQDAFWDANTAAPKDFKVRAAFAPGTWDWQVVGCTGTTDGKNCAQGVTWNPSSGWVEVDDLLNSGNSLYDLGFVTPPTLFTSLLLRGRNYLDLLRYPAPPLLNVR